MHAKTIALLEPLPIIRRAGAPAIEVHSTSTPFDDEFAWARDQAFDDGQIPEHELRQLRAADAWLETGDIDALDALDARANDWALSL